MVLLVLHHWKWKAVSHTFLLCVRFLMVWASFLVRRLRLRTPA
uniref:Uncharacterized protein n=1 Tax=Nymphaea colorata TaxID=210225 RepID=A0A5K0VEU8_9MAGN